MIFHKKINSNSVLNAIVNISIFIFPVLFISTPKVTTALATLLFFACFILIYKFKYSSLSAYEKFDLKLIGLAFLIYFLTIVFSQIFQSKFNASEYQQQGRFLLLLPLFLFVFYKKINFNNLIIPMIFVACIVGTISSLYFFEAPAAQWGASRHTVQHIDPLNFGYLMLFLGFSSLLIAIRWTKSSLVRIIGIVSFCLGLYMAIKSGSRTGWLAIPLVVLWILITSDKLKWQIIFVTIVATIIGCFLLYNFSSTIHARLNIAIVDLQSYVWTGNPAANDTSLGVRISMLRMGWYCFMESPLYGFGMQNLYDTLNTNVIKLYATDSVIQFASSGFMHNELLTQMVRHGVFGAFAFLFIIGCIFYIYRKLYINKIKSPMNDVFIIYIIFALIASLSTEILVVKPMILFFAFMLACYAGESLWKIHEAEHAATS